MKFTIKRKYLPEVDYTKKYEPNTAKVWFKKLLSEFLGTVLFCYLIALLGTRMQNGIKFEALMTGDQGIWISRLVIGLWVALDILVCLFLFSKMSCDINPAVSFYSLLSKKETAKFVWSKILIQFCGGIAAAGLIVLTQHLSYLDTGNKLNSLENVGRVTDSAKPELITNPKTPLVSQFSTFLVTAPIGNEQAVVQGETVIKHVANLAGEVFGTFILIWAVFSRAIKGEGTRIFLVALICAIGVATLLEIGTVGWNPARSITSNLAFDLSIGSSNSMIIFWTQVIGPLIACYLLYYGTVFFKRKVYPVWDKMIFWRNIE